MKNEKQIGTSPGEVKVRIPLPRKAIGNRTKGRNGQWFSSWAKKEKVWCQCEVCTGRFLIVKKFPQQVPRKTCSRLCHNRLIHKIRRDGLPKTEEFTCLSCGKISIGLRGRGRKFCSAGCLFLGRRGRGEGRKKPGNVHRGTQHYRANKIKKNVLVCEWIHIGHCLGRLEVAHVDGNFRHTEASNLLKLCVSHHKLLDSGAIDPKNPVVPEYYIAPKSGIRVYRHNQPYKTWRH